MAGEDISFGFHLITYSGTSGRGRREMNQFIYFLCQKKERGRDGVVDHFDKLSDESSRD